MCNEYNGWTNYPTWNIVLWINDDYYQQENVLELAGECFSESRRHTMYGEKRYNVAVRLLAESLKYQYQDYTLNAHLDTGSLVDILGWALSQVNWHEVAGSFIDQWLENVKYHYRER